MGRPYSFVSSSIQTITAGLGISPNHALRLVGFTTDRELHPALKIFYSFVVIITRYCKTVKLFKIFVSLFVNITKSQQPAAVEKPKQQKQLQGKNDRNADHEFFVQGLVVNGAHNKVHCGTAAKGAQEKQGAFGDTPAVLFGCTLVPSCDNGRDCTDSAEINE
jgi:hypothetical protein